MCTWKDLLAAPEGDDAVREAMFQSLVSDEALGAEAPEALKGKVVLSDHAMEQMINRDIGLPTVLRAVARSRPRRLRQQPLCMHSYKGVRVVVRKRGSGMMVVVSTYPRTERSKRRRRSRDVIRRDDGNRRANEKMLRRQRRRRSR
jgi:hypothetical protein